MADWVRQMVGLSETWSGVIRDTASTSTLVALISARGRTTDYALSRGGLQAEEQPLAIYVSAHSHSSVDKGALLAGFGRANLRLVPFDAEYGMRPDALEELVQRDLPAGARPRPAVPGRGAPPPPRSPPVAGPPPGPRAPYVWSPCGAQRR